MTFASIPHGAQLFLDANTLVYYFTADLRYGAACLQLLDRIARQEIHGFTSAHVVLDTAHRVMTLEAMHVVGLPAKGIAAHLRQQPAEVQKLTRFRQAVDLVPQMGLQVLPLDFALVSTAAARSQQYGLLTGDALVVAVMQAHGLTHLASADTDFDRVPGITRYAPV
jgi:predicted nucleic acid-binding protein